jgi:hypothetical protein
MFVNVAIEKKNTEEGTMSESLYYLCEQYIHIWWREGYEKGQRRHKLRLH